MNDPKPAGFRFGFSVAAALLVSGWLSASEMVLPEDTSRLMESPLPGYTLATTYCYTCHSTDYLRYQPPMTRAAWKASVTKMQKTFGAVIPESAVEPIAEYLAKTYGTERGAVAPARSTKAPQAANDGRK
ncbi:MAG: cytochrome c [Opitutaceae bacterium]